MRERQQADPSPWLIARHSQVRDVAIGVCGNRCVRFVILVELQALLLNMKYDFTIAFQRPLRTVSTLMQAYHMEQSRAGCGIGTCGNWYVGFLILVELQAESLNLRYDLMIKDPS